MTLRGRSHQCAELLALLDRARSGRSGSVVITGEPGMGKTALLEWLGDNAADFQVLRAAGVESEVELPYAGLQQLCVRLFDSAGLLPDRQRRALEGAIGREAGPPDDRLPVGLGILGLMAYEADRRPLLCLVDDAQWMDTNSTQTLSFVARRLESEAVAMVFAARGPGAPRGLGGLPQMLLSGLAEAEARELLALVVPGRLDDEVRDRIIAETGGNPLALLELPRAMPASGFAGGYGLPEPGSSVTELIEDSFLRRIRVLPDRSRLLMVLAAAEPTGDPALFWRAAALLDIGAQDAADAENDGLLRLGARVTFRHPLVRSAVYQWASTHDRQTVHRALAEATDTTIDQDRKTWHLAQATNTPSEKLAGELQRCAVSAHQRGGFAAEAAFLERAAALTIDPAERAELSVDAARAKYEGGAAAGALWLLNHVDMPSLAPLSRGVAARLRAQIAFTSQRDGAAPGLLLAAAAQLEPLDAELARETYLEALWAAMRAGRGTNGPGLNSVAAAAAGAAVNAPRHSAVDLLLDGLTTRCLEGYTAAVPAMRRAIETITGGTFVDTDQRWLWIACHTAMDLWDDEACRQIVLAGVQHAHHAGALTVLPFALNYVAAHHVFAGEFDAAEELIDEATSICDATGTARMKEFSLLLSAWRGSNPETVLNGLTELTDTGEGLAIAFGDFAAAVLHNGLGQYPLALIAAQRVYDHDELGFGVWVLPEQIEAAQRVGQPEQAASALRRLHERTSLSRTDWALGMQARSTALLLAGSDAEEQYQAAIRHLERSMMVVHLARAHLIYGEWLRRERRRIDARTHLRTALHLFHDMGAVAFAARAEGELVATGERARTRETGAAPRLTPQQSAIARLASDGHSNSDIAGQLYISPRTVEYHLHKVFTTLNITSRNQLNRALATHRS